MPLPADTTSTTASTDGPQSTPLIETKTDSVPTDTWTDTSEIPLSGGNSAEEVDGVMVKIRHDTLLATEIENSDIEILPEKLTRAEILW